MQAYVLMIIVSALLAQELQIETPALFAAPWLMLLYLGVYGIMAVFFYIAGRRAGQLIEQGQASDQINRLAHRLFQFLLRVSIAWFLAGIFVLGWPDAMAEVLGKATVMNALLIALPSLLVPVWMMFCSYPMDRATRLNNQPAIVIENHQSPEPTPKIWSRWQYMFTHLRLQLLIMLIPLTAMVLWSDLVLLFLPESIPEVLIYALQLLGVIVILFFSPRLTVFIFDTSPMPDGPTHKMLRDILSRHQIKLRAMLRWNTHGMLLNGAVTGFTSRWRYILLTDLLLDRMTSKHITAVMAHEIGHIHYRHMIWMLIGLSAILSTAMLLTSGTWSLLSGVLIPLLDPMLRELFNKETLPWDTIIQSLGAFCGVLLWLPCFGWLSRRYERQADTFAARHMTESLAEENAEAQPDRQVTQQFSTEGIEQTTQALLNIAFLNHIPIRKHTWRHGSIQWRVDYLHSLVNQPMDQVPVDRQLKVLNRLLLIVFLLSLILQGLSFVI